MTAPNFLLISADQQRGDCIGVEGRRVRTPHLDAMAGGGTRFSAAITPCVVCQPARASILTGVLPRTHGVHDNGIDLDPERGENGFAGRLGANGYEPHSSARRIFRPITPLNQQARPSAPFPPQATAMTGTARTWDSIIWS